MQGWLRRITLHSALLIQSRPGMVIAGHWGGGFV
jgi:hypothetical protein